MTQRMTTRIGNLMLRKIMSFWCNGTPKAQCFQPPTSKKHPMYKWMGDGQDKDEDHFFQLCMLNNAKSHFWTGSTDMKVVGIYYFEF